MSKEINAKMSVTFTKAGTFQEITNGENITASFSKMAQWHDEIASKVAAVSGKGLSTNDYTNADKAKVDGAAPQSTTYTKTEIDAMIGSINSVLEEVL